MAEKLKVALVHDFITEYGGAERVLEALHEIYPGAPVFTAFYDQKSLGPNKKKFDNWDIRVSWVKFIPFFNKILSPARILSPLIFESFDLSGFDVVISSTNMYFAKTVLTGPKTLHFCYCHTPPRYLYGYPTARDWKKGTLSRIVGGVSNHFLRIVDFASAQRVDYFIANSKNTASRIEKFYRREAAVIYPPVDLERFAPRLQSTVYRLQPSPTQPQQKKAVDARKLDSYYLSVSRLARAKRIDLAIAAASKLGLHLKIIGTGREEETLKKLAAECKIQNSRRRQSGYGASATKCKIDFLGEVSDEKLISAYQNCKAVIFPAEDEDFGLVPVEAQAAGKPVVALKSGGVTESVIDASAGPSTLRLRRAQSSRSGPKGSAQATGVLFDQPTVESLIEGIKRLSGLEIKRQDCLKQAQKFDKVRFKKEVLKFIADKLDQMHFKNKDK